MDFEKKSKHGNDVLISNNLIKVKGVERWWLGFETGKVVSFDPEEKNIHFNLVAEPFKLTPTFDWRNAA